MFDLKGRSGKAPTYVCTQAYVYGAVSGVCIGVWKLKAPYLHFLILLTKSQLKPKTTLVVRCAIRCTTKRGKMLGLNDDNAFLLSLIFTSV